jgi:hypothetical protein
MATNANEEPTEAGRADDSLAETARTEREYLRERLSAELGHNPTDEELDTWLREHTEGY